MSETNVQVVVTGACHAPYVLSVAISLEVGILVAAHPRLGAGARGRNCATCAAVLAQGTYLRIFDGLDTSSAKR